MSYMRGQNYIWCDDHRVHLWISEGYDGWDESVWYEPGSRPRHADSPSTRTRASGVAVPQNLMDDYVVMRFAELIDGGVATDVIERALATQAGNGGCSALANNAPRLRAFLSST